MRFSMWVLVGLTPLLSRAQALDRHALGHLLDFESEQPGRLPRGWGGGPDGTIFADDRVVHGGKWAARLQRDAASPSGFSTITASIPMDFAGSKIELRGFLKTESVSGFVGLWMREDGDGGMVEFDNMQRRQLKGTHNWAEYSISLPLNPNGKQLYFGVLIAGTGTTWVDDMQMLVDGKPIEDALKAEKAKTVLDNDHEFDHGSRISLVALSQTQMENLAMLGRVWGFLKYHHPAITAGQRHWDFDLFRILPRVLAAPDAPSANIVMHKWIADLGTITDCKACASLSETELYLKPDLGWISDEKTLGSDLSRDLRRIYRNRSVNGSLFFIAKVPGVGNPVFENELAYPAIKFPDAGFQILALFRIWNIIEYWYPYRDIVGENWDDVLTEFLPRIALAKDAEAFQLELMAFIAEIHDTHANLWSSIQLRPPVGKCRLPIVVRFVENQALITGYSESDEGPSKDLKIGDAIKSLDGASVKQLVARWSPFYADSNTAARDRDMARSMTRGECGPATLEVRRENQNLKVETRRVETKAGKTPRADGITHDLDGDTFQMLSNDVGYLKLSSIKIVDVPKYIEKASKTKGLIIDIRNYPSEFVVFALGSLLVNKPTEFVRFTSADLANPGAFGWGPPLSLKPASPHYEGKVVILVDEVTQSQAEYTTMALRSAPGVMVVGSTTAGADGNVSRIPIPGGFSTMISGIGVFYPDKRPTQRVGIIPDIKVEPTVTGIRAGRDEVLEEAMRQILGPGAHK